MHNYRIWCPAMFPFRIYGGAISKLPPNMRCSGHWNRQLTVISNNFLKSGRDPALTLPGALPNMIFVRF